MRHLHFTQSLEPLYGGGLGTSTVAMHKQFLAAGVPSIICATHGGTPQRLADATHEFHRIKPDFLYYAPALRRAAPDLVRNADILHSHGFYVGTNFILGREARRQRKHLVCHVHGMFEPYILGRSRWKKQLVHWLFEDANFRHAKFWRALTLREADQIWACGITAPVAIVPVGIDPKAFELADSSASSVIETPLRPQLKKTRRRALFISRLHPKKGLDLLVPAWAALGSSGKDWELIIAGPDEGGHAAAVDRWIAESGVQDSVWRVGRITQDAKIKLLRSADLFVLPSYSEGFPSALLEAMAVALPVVATSACNFPELFQHEAGWQCEATRDSVTTALRAAVASSEAERRQRGGAGRRLLERDYTWPQIARRLLDACAEHCR